MFTTMFNYKPKDGTVMECKSPTVPGMAKSLAELAEKYVSLGVQLPDDDKGYFDSDIPVDQFGVELEDVSDMNDYFNNRSEQLRTASQPQQPTQQATQQGTPPPSEE